MRVLIIEDNPDIVANLYGYLEPLGYSLDTARTSEAGLDAATRGNYDAILLDIMLPGMNGLVLCRRLRREARKETPVLMLSARDTIADKISGFDSGADDYLVKPHSLAELHVRLKALVRRAQNTQIDAVLTVGDLRLDTSSHTVVRASRTLKLTPTGYKILARLMRAWPEAVTRETLEYEIWGDEPPDSDSLRTLIHALRQALDKSFGASMLKTQQGIGYRLDDPAAKDAGGP